MKFLRNTPREPREQRPRGSLDGPSRTITVEPVETPTPAPPPEVRPEPSRKPERPSSPSAPPTPTR